MSVLRARCPSCRTLTAVALDRGYECHVCGGAFAAGLVRVPRAFGTGGEAMAAAAALELPYPEAAVVGEGSVEAQAAGVAAALPRPPLVLGGCCCAHLGAIRGLAARHGRISVVWLDAHGDLNTPETSPSGNLWGMPLRMAIDEGSVAPGDVALWGARDLDAAEVAFMAANGIDDDIGRAAAGTAAVYVALDADVLEPGELACFMPAPGGPTVADVETELRSVASVGVPVAGLGLTGLTPDADIATLLRFTAALGL